MASVFPDTPPPKPPGTAPSPSRKLNGVDLDKQYLQRNDKLRSIYDTAKEHQYVVIGAPASTGKTSLLHILKKELETQKKASVVYYPCRRDGGGVASALQDLAGRGVDTKNQQQLHALQNTWLLLDDAQSYYTDDYDAFWEIIVKDIDALNVKGLFIVIAATYDLSAGNSPVTFEDVKHVDPYICEEEAKQLIDMHFGHWKLYGWETLRDTLLGLSALPGQQLGGKFHIGVIMAAMRAIEEFREQVRSRPSMELTEDLVLKEIRATRFVEGLGRCFFLAPGTVTDEVRDFLLWALTVPENQKKRAALLNSLIGPLIRAGMITCEGQFSCLAAHWYYNQMCFPNRARSAPGTLRDLIVKAVGSMSAKRLVDSIQSGFPKEAAFQQLFNEAMALHLPPGHSIIPELNTRVVNPDDPSSKPVTGELDFYINGELQWCLEIDRQGDMIGKHLDHSLGKYREVEAKEYYVVDCRRGPKVGSGVRLKDPHRCTLYFALDFMTCLCEIAGQPDVPITLQI